MKQITLYQEPWQPLETQLFIQQVQFLIFTLDRNNDKDGLILDFVRAYHVTNSYTQKGYLEE